MPKDVGGGPFPDGWEPDDDRDHRVSDEEFASVVFDDAFVRAAVVHEPTAVERLLAAARARAEAAEAEAARRGRTRGERPDGGYGGLDRDDLDLLDHPYGAPDGYGRQIRWHRPVAWMLALVMGVGMVALAFTAVYRGTSSGGGPEQAPSPTSTGPEQSGRSSPSFSAERSRHAVTLVPRSP